MSIIALRCPPSISIIVPFMKWARSDAMNVAKSATSSVVQMRPNGILALDRRSASSLDIFQSRAIASSSPSHLSVSTGPGFIATKVMLSFPYCPANDKVKFCPAALAAPGVISQ